MTVCHKITRRAKSEEINENRRLWQSTRRGQMKFSRPKKLSTSATIWNTFRHSTSLMYNINISRNCATHYVHTRTASTTILSFRFEASTMANTCVVAIFSDGSMHSLFSRRKTFFARILISLRLTIKWTENKQSNERRLETKAKSHKWTQFLFIFIRRNSSMFRLRWSPNAKNASANEKFDSNGQQKSDKTNSRLCGNIVHSIGTTRKIFQRIQIFASSHFVCGT